MEFNLSAILGNSTTNGNKGWARSSSGQTCLVISVFKIFAVLLFIFIGTLINKKSIGKILSLVNPVSTKGCTGIPSVSLWPILKSLYLYGLDFQRIFEGLISKYGEIFKLNLLGLHNVIFVMNPAMVQKLYMSTDPGHLLKPKWYVKIMPKVMEDGLVNLPTDSWKLHRSAISKAFAYNGLLRQLNIIEEHTKRFVLTLQETCLSTDSLKTPVISFEKQVLKLTYEIMSHIASGKEVIDVSPDEKTWFHEKFERVKELMSYRIHHPLNYIDFIWNINPQKWEMDRIVDELCNYSKKVIPEIRKQFDDKKCSFKVDDDMAGKSIAEVMMKAGLSNEEIFTELVTLMVAGHDTTSTSVNLVLFLLATHKEYQNKCREEIDQMFHETHISICNEIPMESLKSLKFLDMCIKECLRLYPIIPVIGRDLASPMQLDENTYIPLNSYVITSPWIIHHNPNTYPEPEKFNPERFSPENKGNRGISEYMPFSLGPRNCIGLKTAMIELKVVVAYVLHNFEVDSDMSVDYLNQSLRKTAWPIPDLGITIKPRQ